MDILVFRLYGPMASWGEIAVGESRHTASYPSKSAIIGLLGAALGIARDEEEKQQQLQQGYALAVELLSAGSLLRDYHTTQVPDSVGKFTYRTRRDEVILGKERLGTILSSREYRTDALALVAVRALVDAPFTLAEIQAALLQPKYHLYLGRKSCPLAAPLQPQLITDQLNYFAAFKAYQHKPILPTSIASDGTLAKRDYDWLGRPSDRHYYWEGLPEDFSDDTLALTRRQTRTRHDQPLSRKRWQFMPRQEHYLFCSGDA
ncbi:CRISPR system Cascade subunit CasD [Methylobacter tundripaludum]|uniref:CRISPR system Cascade subunit CasD n=1 Tax=Methylobacter tundripaludum TaxID=173365 RepID=A0A2S6HGL3_9GAMM|nr:type I-E CRISPR-associated protein Cas5/CasD [Methylobacter tundripaludum]PPK76586.1 CRISPR system Cascade subunit CasD [Methylobacter tundripaludum]